MSDKASGNWLPYNLDGTAHDCKTQNQNETGTKKVETKPDNEKAKAWVREVFEGPKLNELDDRVKRLEAILLGDRN